MSEPNTRPGFITVVRDVVSYLIGVALLAKQAGIFFSPPPTPNDTLIWIGALLIGVPGVAQLIAWRFGGGSASTTAPLPPSPVAQPSQSGPLPSSSAGGSE